MQLDEKNQQSPYHLTQIKLFPIKKSYANETTHFPLLKNFFFLAFFTFLLSISSYTYAQSFRVVNFGDDVLAVGAGARALGMGSAYSALSDDLTAAYWNPASLTRSTHQKQAAYMHSERFGGAVAYDYAAFAMKIPNASIPSAIAVSVFRQGVDGIKNTTNAWDMARGLPRPNPEQYFTTFSASDLAVLLTYAQQRSERLRLGVNLRFLYSRLGPFANGSGYSVDLSMLYHTSFADIALQIQNATGLLKFWTVNADEFGAFTDAGDEIPEGQNEFIRPSIRLGIARSFAFKNEFWKLNTALDTHLRFNNQRTFYISAGPMSIEPHLGAELAYRSLLFARAGVTDFVTNFDQSFSLAPTMGAGIRIKSVMIDYAFASFAGPTVDLGYTHRISVQVGW